MTPYLAEFLPNRGDRESKPHQHAGAEFFYLLSGHLDVQHGEVTHHIEPGDAVYFDATTIHSYTCAGDQPATALIVTLQQPVNTNGSGRGNGFSSARGRITVKSGLPRITAEAVLDKKRPQ